jgi:uncharacterized protein YdhG (YjbR/CyaY superfamily)
MKKNLANSVDAYIANCPNEVQDELRKIRSAIRVVAPDAIERTDYFNIPGYSYEGYDYDGMFAWFSYKKPNVRLHVRPPVIEEHKKELVGCVLTKGIVTFPEDKKIPITLVKKLVKASIKVMKDKS